MTHWTHVSTIEVIGEPKGQPRPRAFARGARAGVYDPGTADEWKARVITAAQSALLAEPVKAKVRCEMVFQLPRPGRLNRKSDPDGAIWCDAKPDADNLAKAVLDALTQVRWFADDKQVVSLLIEKYYHSRAGRPGAIIRLFVQP